MATLASMLVRLGIDTDDLNRGAAKAKTILTGLGKSVGALGVGVPAAAAVATGVGGMAAAFASAGVAAKAFQLAVGPQLQEVADVSKLAEEAEKAAAEGAKDAAEKQQAYTDALNRLPKATRTMAKEFIGLKSDYKGWSDELSKDTMPVFTKGLEMARRLLPLLTPFVKAAAKAFGDFLGEIDKGIKGKGLEKTAQSMAKLAGQNLKSFLAGVKNIAIGIVGIVKAFVPFSGQMSGGFEKVTKAFADWGQSLGKSEGFAQFITLAKQGAQTLGILAAAALKLVVALAPLIGVSAQLALWLAKLINAMPPGVLAVLAGAITGVVVAMKAYKAYTAITAAATTLLESSAFRAIAGWARMLAWGLRTYARIAAAAVASAARTAAAWAGQALRSIGTWVAAVARAAVTSAAQFVRIAAASVASAARTAAAWVGSALASIGTWVAAVVRAAVTALAQFALMAARAIAWAAIMAAQWLIAMGPIGWIIAIVIALVALIIAKWDTIKAWTQRIWDWLWNKIKSVAQFILDLFMNWTIIGQVIKHWDAIKSKTIAIWNAVVNWVKAIPGKIVSFFLNWTLPGLIIKHWDRIKSGVISKASALLSWVRGLPGRIVSALGNLGSLLLGAGRRLIQGFINGIRNMIGSLRSTLGSITSMLPDWKGPERVDARILTPAGESLIGGFMRGIAAQVPALRSQLQGITGDLPGMTVQTPRGVTRASNNAQQRRLVLDVTGTEGLFKAWIRDLVQVDAGGDVQRAFGSS